MFLCLDCGYLFETPKVYDEVYDFDPPFHQYTNGCPKCAGAYVETQKCDCCDEYITGRFIVTRTGEIICEDCYLEYDIMES